MLVASIVRMLAVRALRGRTLAGPAVFDSRVEPLDEMTRGRTQPVICVHVGEATEGEAGDGFFARDAMLTLSLDLIVAGKVQIDDGEESVAIIETDAGLEFSLSVLDRQWRTALSDPVNAHAEALRTLVSNVGTIRSTRGMDATTGQKHAIRMIEADLAVIAEPAPGAALPQAIDAALTLLASDPDCAGPVAVMRAEFAGGGDLFDWQKAQAMMFATGGVPAALGIGTPDGGAPVELDAIGVVVNGSGGAWTEPDDA